MTALGNDGKFQLARADTNMNLGLLYSRQAKIKDAEQFYRNSLVVYEALSNADDNPEINNRWAACLNNLGTVMLDNGRVAEARPLLQQARRCSKS